MTEIERAIYAKAQALIKKAQVPHFAKFDDWCHAHTQVESIIEDVIEDPDEMSDAKKALQFVWNRRVDALCAIYDKKEARIIRARDAILSSSKGL